MSYFPGQPGPYPPPYQPPRPDSRRRWPMAMDLLAPSRHAGLLLLIVGGLALAAALMLLGARHNVSDQTINRTMVDWPKSQPRPSPDYLRRAMSVYGVICSVLGLYFISLGIAVRRGGKPPAIIAIGTCGVAILALLFMGFSIMAVGSSASGVACSLCIILPGIAIFGLATRSLLRSLSTSRTLASYYQQSAMPQMNQPYPPAPTDAETIPDYNTPPLPPAKPN